MSKEDEFATSLERSGTKAFEWAEAYMKKMTQMIGRELGSTEVSTDDELMQYAQMRHDPALLRQAFLEPLRAKHGKGRGNEMFVDYVKEMEKQLYSTDGKGY